MSLQVWLPLNGNLNNQGLSDMTFSYINNNGKLSVNNSGKIGKCYERTASEYADLIRSNSTINLSGDITMMCWAYVSSTIGDTANGLVTNHSHDDSTGIGITVKEVSSSDYRISCNTGTGSTRTYNAYYGTTNIKNAWHHLSVTYNKSLKRLQLWVDGNVEYTLSNYTNASKSDRIDIFNWSTTYYTNGSYRPVCKLCDVRIYDHCLSPMEVKEISKGLVCHYKLSGPGASNLVKDSMVNLTNTEYMIKSFSLSEALVAGNKYSITIKSDIGTRYWIGMWLDGGSVACGGMSSHPDENGIVKITFTCPTANNYSAVYIFSGTTKGVMGSNGETVTLNYIKIEKGSLFTPWCPNSADVAYTTLGYNSNIEYDCSGYGNNATKTGTINWSSDSRRYSGSYIPANTSSYLSTTLVTGGYANSYTIAYWAKISDMTGRMVFGFGDGNRLNLYPSGVFCWNTGDGSNNPFKNNGTSISYESYNGGWHHYAITGNGTTATLYIDGVRVGDATTYKGITGTKLFISGWDSGTGYKWDGGNISDFRIYATPLSAQDIKSLYQTAASVSKSGVMAAYEFVEE